MSEESNAGGAGGGTDETPEVVVEGRRGISPVWLIPVVAIVVAASLAWNSIQNRGPEVVVVFESAEGLEAGKSKVKFREVEIGFVQSSFATIRSGLQGGEMIVLSDVLPAVSGMLLDPEADEEAAAALAADATGRTNMR